MSAAREPRKQVWRVRQSLYLVSFTKNARVWIAKCPRPRITVREPSFAAARDGLRARMMMATAKRKSA